MAEVQERKVQVIRSFGSRKAALAEGGFLLGKLGRGSLSVIEQYLEPFHLQGIDDNLVQGHIPQFHVVENLDIRLCHCHAHVFPGFLQVGSHGLEIQLVLLDVVGEPESLVDRYRSAEAQACRSGVRIGICIVGGKSTPEREVLAGAGAYVRQLAALGHFQLDFLLPDLEVLLLQGYVVHQGVVYALPQGPWAMVLGPG